MAQLGVRTFIRLGTTGGIQPELDPGDVIVTTGAVRLEATTKYYVDEGYPAVADYTAEGHAAAAAQLVNDGNQRIKQILDNLRQAMEHLRSAGVERIGVIGWCFGGGWSLRTALAFPDKVNATVIYYGRLTTDQQELESLSSPVLGIFGALDQGIPVETVQEFEAALEESKTVVKKQPE